jgi:hypothetical protein
LLSSTTTNISKTYNQISKNGNIHDFTVSEKYSIGSAKYKFYDGSTVGGDNYTGESSDGYSIP